MESGKKKKKKKEKKEKKEKRGKIERGDIGGKRDSGGTTISL